MIRARASIRRAFVALLLCALCALFIPAQAKAAARVAKSSCCARMKMDAESDKHCPMHQQSPPKEQDASCCQGCALGLALLFVAPPDFVYAQTGETALGSLITRSQSLPHRPPVPPPRSAIG